MKRLSVIQSYKWKILFWIILFSLIGSAIIYGPKYGINQRIVVLVTLVLGIFTQIFSGITSLIALIPFFGPPYNQGNIYTYILHIKCCWLGCFWIAIKKGYANELSKSRTVTLALLIGIIIGYILGNIIPLE